MKNITTNKTTKIIVDILMTIFMILSFVRWEDSNFAFHAIVGIASALFFTLHTCIHWRWLKATTKSFLNGKLNKALKWKYHIDILLLVFWSIAIVTGFIAIGNFSYNVEALAAFSRLHGITSRIGLVLVIIHAFQHLPQIKSYLGIKQKSTNTHNPQP